ncbi:MAG: MFS transporter, partial [Gammaproteobacteria bacterium]
LAIFTCALGVFLFSQSHTLLYAQLSRAMMGAGVAFATVAYMKLASAWFAPRQYAFVGGLLATAAMAGAVFGQAPLALIINSLGWRQALLIVGLVGFAAALLFAIIVRDSPESSKPLLLKKETHITFNDVMQVFTNKQNWLLTLYGGLAFSPIAIFGGLWGTPFIMQAYDLSNTQAASMVSLVFIGLGIGSPLLGILSDRIGDRLNVMFYSTLISCLFICLVLYCHPLPTWIVGTSLFIFGFGLGAFMLVFAIGKEINSIRLTATVIAMINASDAILDAITEPAIGKLLDIHWDGKIVDGVHYFSLHSYHFALSVLPAFLVIAALLLLWVKKT